MSNKKSILLSSCGARVLLAGCVGLAGGLAAAPAFAQSANQPGQVNQLAEIVVTATKTGATSIQKTPLAISAFSANDLEKSSSHNIKDLAAYAPSVNIGQNTGNAMIYIRGIGTNNVIFSSEPDVTVQLDGVYLARPGVLFNDFIDVDRVEVLRGPQGTLYGRNAVGGTINIISKTPSDILSGDAAVSYGNFNAVQAQGFVTGPIIPGQLQFSLAVNYQRHDAYIKNIDPTGNNIDTANHGGLHAQLRWEPSSQVTATTRVDWMALNESPNSFSVPVDTFGPATLANKIVGSTNFETALNSPQYWRQNNTGVSEDIQVTLSPNWSLRSITAFRQYNADIGVDVDDTDLNSAFARLRYRENQESQEFDLNWNYSRFKGVVGAYYFREPDEAITFPLFPGGNPKLHTILPVQFLTTDSVETNAQAVFAQGTYKLTDTLSLTVGYRYTLEQKSFNLYDTGFTTLSPPITQFTPAFTIQENRDFSASTPKFGLEWQVTPSDMLYFSATRGYKSGGFYPTQTPSTLGTTYNPEAIWSYEVGAKTDWFDRRLRVNVDGFYYDYSNLQVLTLLAPGFSSVSNAATATVKGVEVEIHAKPLPQWQITANGTYLDATYTSYPNATPPATLNAFLAGNPRFNAAAGAFNASGHYLNQAPKLTAFASAERDWNFDFGSMFARAEYSYTDRSYYDPSNAKIFSQGAYSLVNAAVGYNAPNGRWSVQVYGKNLANKEYFIMMAGNGGAVIGGIPGDPRTYGVRVGYHF